MVDNGRKSATESNSSLISSSASSAVTFEPVVSPSSKRLFRKFFWTLDERLRFEMGRARLEKCFLLKTYNWKESKSKPRKGMMLRIQILLT